MWDELRRLFRQDLRLIVLTNLHNPSGVVLEESTLLRSATIAQSVECARDGR